MLDVSIEYELTRRSDQDLGLYCASWATWIKTGSVVHVQKQKPFYFQLIVDEEHPSRHIRRPTLTDKVWFSVYETTLFSGDPESSPSSNALVSFNPSRDGDKENRLFYQTHLCDISLSFREIDSNLQMDSEGNSRAVIKKEIVDRKLMDYEKKKIKNDTGDYNRGFIKIIIVLERRHDPKKIMENIRQNNTPKTVFAMSKYRKVTASFDQNYSNVLNADSESYSREFLSVFPLSRDSSAGTFAYVHNARTERIATPYTTLVMNHLPSFKTDYGRLPILFYYLHKVRPTRVNSRHKHFLKKLSEIVMSRYGVSSERFCSSINAWLTGNAQKTDKEARKSFMTCMEIYAEIITEMSNNVKYRSDFRLRVQQSDIANRYQDTNFKRKNGGFSNNKSREETVLMESVDWDLVLNFSGCDDCEGVDRLTAEIVHILENGIVGKSTQRRDLDSYPLLKSLYGDALRDKKKIYGWNDTLLDCLQAISLHYVHSSTLIAAGTDSGGDFHETPVTMKNKIPIAGDAYKIGTDADLKGDYGCHMFSMAIPWNKTAEYIDRVFETEDKQGARRSSRANETVELVRKIKTSLRGSNFDNYLPLLCIESTARVRPFFVSKVFDFEEFDIRDVETIDEEIEDRYFDYVVNNEDGNISDALMEDSCSSYRVSTLNWIPGEDRKRHVSTFYRQCAYSFSSKLFELDPELGVLAWVDTKTCKWGLPVPFVMRDENLATGLLSVHHRMGKIKETMWEHMVNLEDVLPPVGICDTNHAPTCENIGYERWCSELASKFPSLNRHIQASRALGRARMGSNIKKNLTLSYYKNFYVCDDYLSSKAAIGLIKFFDDVISSGRFDSISVYRQTIYPIFGKHETVIVLNK